MYGDEIMKTLRVEDEVWASLYNLKILNRDPSINEVIKKLLERE